MENVESAVEYSYNSETNQFEITCVRLDVYIPDDIEEIYGSYEEYWDMLADTNGYTYHDINKDGVDEFITHTGTCEADRVYRVYTFRDGTMTCAGAFGGWHGTLYQQDKSIIIVGSGATESGMFVTAVTYELDNMELVKKDVFEKEYTDDAEWEAYFENLDKTGSGTCGDNVTWTFDDSTGTLTISGTGAMDNYSSDIYIDSPSGFSWGLSDVQPWHDYDEQIKEVIINEGVVTIGNCAFGGCDNLTKVSIPNSVTTIGDIAFVGCSKLTEITIPNCVTTIGKGAFCGCGIVRITIPNNVTSIGEYAFHRCDSLTNIEVGSSNKYYSSDDYGVLFNKTKTTLMYYPKANINTSYTIPNTVVDIAIFAFADCDNLTNIIIPEGVVSIGYCAFSLSENITSITIPSSVTSISEYAFIMCDDIMRIWVNENNKKYSSDEKGVLFNKDKTLIIQYPSNGDTNYIIPNSTSTIGDYAFFNSKLASITIPNSVTSIGKNAFGYISALTDVYYSGTEKQWNQVSIGEYNSNLTDATIHFTGNVEEDIYNLGEETYSFDNFGDSDSAGGHCFGMSITSAGYYNNILDITDIGGSAEKDLYELSKTSKVKNPICHYQAIQGDFSKRAIVAGGNWYLTEVSNINADWNAVVNYVKNHQYDNKGTLQIGFRVSSKGGHAINFLRYEVVNGQERIYAYDNNFPETETYFYKSADGKVYQAPKSTFGTAIDTICLRNIYTYFSGIGEYDKTRYIYGDANVIDVVGAEAFPMECGEGNYTMFELPEEATEAVIIPLVNNASFQYVGEEFSFGDVDENTVGSLVLSTNEDDSITEPEFNIDENPCADGHDFYYGFCTVCGESDIIESAHPYDDDTDETYVIYKEDASYIYIRFSRDTYVEENYDFIEIYDMNDNLVGRYTGDELASEQVTVYGDTAIIKLVSDSSNTGYGFTINDMGYMIIPGTDAGYEFYIQEPSRTTIRNKDKIVLHAIVENAPEGSYIEWTCSEKKFSRGFRNGNMANMYATAEDKGYDTITATLYDADGTILATDSVELYSKSGFFDKIGGFFRNLFGTYKIYDEY